MADRIDHVAKAVEFGNLATDAWNANQREYATALLASAQAHASLALVEQQRIANLIAIYGSEGVVEDGYGSKGVDFGFIVDEIREGLGL